ncbi:pantoate--beta-alanine ligase [Desulfonauticus submarinus]|uniref:Pantothenate synthetase n=2 Tax=Desulfonauticus submarinus TaxID=206665 RepID=A0A1H0D861_9BACT|nr:pantoate--beta-alanine ligase [Desulfonauticus submarinus]
MSMKQITTIPEIRQVINSLKKQDKKISLVPTMGYFHQGHLELMRYAKKYSDIVVVSIFVNPTQFGPNEDFNSYPRDLKRDLDLAKQVGVDIVFTPNIEDIYLPNHLTYVEVEKLPKVLCGKSRPTHFRGVATIVLKLFNICQPDIAVFGQKDWQQLVIIKQMVKDLNIPVKVIGHPIVREPDGLAMSSRNVYLTKEEREQAPAIYEGLCLVKKLCARGMRESLALKNKLIDYYFRNIPLGSIDYLEIVHPFTLEPLDEIKDKALVAVAMYLGKARLIDNILIEVEKNA